MATEVGVPFQGWPLSGQDQSKESGNDIVQEMLDHGSISFGRYAIESLSWEKHSVFSHDTRQEELDKLTCPGLVAKKKAYFEEYYKKIRALKALEEQQPTEIGNTNENLTDPIETDPLNDNTVECEAETTSFSVPEVVMQNELHECESIDKVYPQLVLRNSVNIVEHGMKSAMDSDSLSTSCVTEVSMEKDVHQIDSSTVIVDQGMSSTLDSDSLSTSCVTEVATGKDMPQVESGAVNPLHLVRRKTIDKVEHEKKLKQDFDSLSKDWVKLKKGMASTGRKERGELEIDNKSGKVAAAVTKSVRAIKATTLSRGNVLRQKVDGPQIKSIKEPKQLTQKVNSRETKYVQLRKLSTGGRVACNTRPNSLSSLNRPLTRTKTSLRKFNEASRDQREAFDKLASDPSIRKGKKISRSSLDSLMKPTASSNARSIKSEVQRNSEVAKKHLPSCVPKVLKRDASHPVLSKRWSSNVLAQNKLQRTRSDMSKIPSHGKNAKQAKAALVSRKRVEPKKPSDLKTRSKKLLEPRKEASPTYKRTKQNEDSPLKKKQRQEKRPWR